MWLNWNSQNTSAFPSPLSVNSRNVDSDTYRSLTGLVNFIPRGKYIWKVRIKNLFTALRRKRYILHSFSQNLQKLSKFLYICCNKFYPNLTKNAQCRAKFLLPHPPQVKYGFSFTDVHEAHHYVKTLSGDLYWVWAKSVRNVGSDKLNKALMHDSRRSDFAETLACLTTDSTSLPCQILRKFDRRFRHWY